MDSLSPSQRSDVMSRVRAKDTQPEVTVRRLVHGLGYRYRLHAKDLPGKPDLVFRGRRKIIFVHGCFWHRHSGCKLARMPKSRTDFWTNKLETNQRRDARTLAALKDAGWDVLIVWECELTNPATLQATLLDFLEGGADSRSNKIAAKI